MNSPYRRSSADAKSVDSAKQDVAKAMLENKPDESKKLLGGIYHPWRRFFARTVDITGFSLIAGGLMMHVASAMSPSTMQAIDLILNNPVVAGVVMYIFWLPIEAFMLSKYGFTPSKWVFGISVIGKNSDKLSISKAFIRAGTVWIKGDGIGMPIIAIFTRVFAYRRLTSTGTTLWDEAAGSVVVHANWSIWRAALSIALTILVYTVTFVLYVMSRGS